MALLKKCVYGYENDSKKTPFNLLNNQVRVDSMIDNAGWFNAAGERLGGGDLSIKDMGKISRYIPSSEMFFVLSEVNSSWDMPKELDRAAPGFDYVVRNATWICCTNHKTGPLVIRVRGDEFPAEDALKDGVKYIKLPRKSVYTALGYDPKTNSFIKSAPVKKDASIEAAKAKLKELYDKLTPAQQKAILAPPVKSSLTSSVTGAKTVAVVPASPIGAGPKSVSTTSSTVKSTTKKTGGYITANPKKP